MCVDCLNFGMNRSCVVVWLHCRFFNSHDREFHVASLPYKPDFKVMPEGWDGITKDVDEVHYEISKKEDEMLYREFVEKMNFNKKKVSSPWPLICSIFSVNDVNGSVKSVHCYMDISCSFCWPCMVMVWGSGFSNIVSTCPTIYLIGELLDSCPRIHSKSSSPILSSKSKLSYKPIGSWSNSCLNQMEEWKF